MRTGKRLWQTQPVLELKAQQQFHEYIETTSDFRSSLALSPRLIYEKRSYFQCVLPNNLRGFQRVMLHPEWHIL